MLLQFKANEAERKMRDAISCLDLEAAIPLRDEWRALKAEADSAANEAHRQADHRKVIDIKTRLPLADGPEAIPISMPATDPAAQEDDLALLEFLLSEVKLGRMKGILAFVGHPEDGQIETVSPWDTSSVWPAYQQFVGAMEEFKHDLLASTADDNDEN